MKNRRIRRLSGLLALPVLMIFPLRLEAAVGGMQVAQSSTTAQPQQPAPRKQSPEPTVQQAREPRQPVRPACLDQFDSLVGDARIQFNWSSSHLRRQEVATIDRIAKYASQCPEAHFQVDGHTDSSGSRRYNQFFSEQRVKTVIDELEARGVDPSRLSPATGHGETEPKESNWSRDGRQANRRVEITMTK